MISFEKIFDECQTKGVEFDENLLNSIKQDITLRNGAIWYKIVKRLRLSSVATIPNLKRKLACQYYALLSCNEYNFKFDIIHAISRLAILNNPNRNKAAFRTILRSIDILDISFNGCDQFTILSGKYGEIKYYIAKKYLDDNRITPHIKYTYLSGYCHLHAKFYGDLNKDSKVVTALCPYLFKGDFYHSFNTTADNSQVIDLSFNGVFDRDIYDLLFSPNELFSLSMEEILANEDNILAASDFDCDLLLNTALYNQALVLEKKQK